MEIVGILYGPNLRPEGIFWVRLVYFSRFVMLYKKSGNTALAAYLLLGDERLRRRRRRRRGRPADRRRRGSIDGRPERTVDGRLVLAGAVAPGALPARRLFEAAKKFPFRCKLVRFVKENFFPHLKKNSLRTC
jgi:hypothetical protein